MSKLDVGVGDEFPLDEGDPRDRHAWKQEYRARRRAMRENRHRHGHHHHRYHHRHLLAHLALLLAVGGFAALIVAGKIPAIAAYGMIALGVAAMLVLGFARARRFRRMHAQCPNAQ